MKQLIFQIFILFCIPATLLAGNSGKIKGEIVDENGQALPFANVFIEGSAMGSTSNNDGIYFILNVAPGSYTLKASYMGYQTASVSDVKVSVDRTTTINFKLKPAVLELGAGLVVIAERPLIVKDRTSSAAIVSAEQLEELPVQELNDVLELQAGVVVDVDGGLHIRGGRSNEISYMVNGIPVTDPFSGEMGLKIENNAVQELSVVSGTFNAEYGQAQSGIINITTKEGGQKYNGSTSYAFGSYYTTAFEYTHINKIRPLSFQDIKGELSGPVPRLNKIIFFLSGRYEKDDGYLYGERWFNVGDSSDFSSSQADQWKLYPSGDSALISMNDNNNYSIQGNLKYQITSFLKLMLFGSYNKTHFREYDHLFKYNPDGCYQNSTQGKMLNITFNHFLTSKLFYELKFARVESDNKRYVFKNPLDERYPPQNFLESKPYNFSSGGAKNEHLNRTSISNVAKIEFNSQTNDKHFIKAGFEGQWFNLTYDWFMVVNNDRTGYKPSNDPAIQGPFGRNEYDVKPVQYAVYIQDKIELTDMIVNVGIRYDYFNSKFGIPQDWRDPQKSKKQDAPTKNQTSPRLGIAYPTSDRGVLHFSYGHFFQIPPFEYIYTNPEFEIVTGALGTLIGNADLEPEQTAAYEIGLQQQLTKDIMLDVTGFYKDIRNLLATEIYRTEQQTRYARYVNRDYGNVRGITLAILKQKKSNIVGASLDYTFSVAEGNSSDPNSVFLDNISVPPIQSEVQLVPLDWDQRHTINATVTVGKKDWGVGLISRFGSGLPYTPTPEGIRSTTFPKNSEKKPATFNVDLQAHYSIYAFNLKWILSLNIFNVFDRRNEIQVYSESGSAAYTIIPGRESIPVVVSTLDDNLTRPDFYAPPRLIKIGLALFF